MEIKPTDENQPTPEIVYLKQQFKLFKPERITSIKSPYEGLEAPLVLALPDSNSRFSLCARFMLDSSSSALSITPFESEMGYEFSDDDLEARKRYEKLKTVNRNRHLSTDKQRFLFDVWTPKGFSINEEILDIAKRLGLQLFFKSGSYESQPRDIPLENRELHFEYFYPLDTGPLPQLDESELIIGRVYPHKGHTILLPIEIDELSQIDTRFVMVEEQPKDPETSSG